MPAGGLPAASSTALGERLRQQLAATEPIRALVLIDADAAVLAASSDDAAASARAIAQREAFGTLRGDASASRSIGAPLPAAAPGAHALLPVALRLGPTGGAFQGALLAFIDLDAFQRVYDWLDTGQSGFATLFLRDGWIVVRAPAHAAVQARNWATSPMFQLHLPKAAVGTVQQVVVADNVERVYTYRALPDAPLVAAFGVSLTEVLAPWRAQRQRDGVVLLLAVLALAGATVAALRQIGQSDLARRALRDSEARFRSLTELSSDWHWRFDEQLRVVEIGAEVKQATSIDRATYTGKRAWELPSLSPGPAEWARFQALLEAHQLFRDFEIRRPDVDCAMRWISTSGRPVFGPQGEFEGYLGVSRDISLRKQSELAFETQRLRIEGVIDSAMDGIITVDADERIVVFNQAAERMFGCAATDLYGQPLGRLLMPVAGATRTMAISGASASQAKPNGGPGSLRSSLRCVPTVRRFQPRSQSRRWRSEARRSTPRYCATSRCSAARSSNCCCCRPASSACTTGCSSPRPNRSANRARPSCSSTRPSSAAPATSATRCWAVRRVFYRAR